jgi:hypothetical protein
VKRVAVCVVHTGILLLPAKSPARVAVIYFQLMRFLVCAKESLYMKHTGKHTMTVLMEHASVYTMTNLMEHTGVNKMAV